MARPLLLDLFCGAGGASVGYHRAGFDVVGVDHRPQPRYPFEFIEADALDVLRRLLDGQAVSSEWPGDYYLSMFAAVHASPPCQAYSRLRHLPWLRGREYPSLIEPTRALLLAIGLPFVIENVEEAPLAKAPSLFGGHGIVLCGLMFGLPIFRHRPFESNVMLVGPPHRRHTKQGRGGHINQRRSQRAQRAAMGIDWMTRDELTQAIPPAYTEHVGRLLLAELAATRLAEGSTG